MSIISGMAYTFMRDQIDGVHDMLGDTWNIALFTTLAELDPKTVTTYTAEIATELVGTGYVAGGMLLAQTVATASLKLPGIDLANVTWAGATWGQSAGTAAQGAMIYSVTQGNKAIALLNFGSPIIIQSGDFTIQWPDPTVPTNAIIRTIA